MSGLFSGGLAGQMMKNDGLAKVSPLAAAVQGARKRQAAPEMPRRTAEEAWAGSPGGSTLLTDAMAKRREAV